MNTWRSTGFGGVACLCIASLATSCGVTKDDQVGRDSTSRHGDAGSSDATPSAMPTTSPLDAAVGDTRNAQEMPPAQSPLDAAVIGDSGTGASLPASACLAMDATWADDGVCSDEPPASIDGLFLASFDGTACVHMGCCAGADCDARMPFDECEIRYASCIDAIEACDSLWGNVDGPSFEVLTDTPNTTGWTDAEWVEVVDSTAVLDCEPAALSCTPPKTIVLRTSDAEVRVDVRVPVGDLVDLGGLAAPFPVQFTLNGSMWRVRELESRRPVLMIVQRDRGRAPEQGWRIAPFTLHLGRPLCKRDTSVGPDGCHWLTFARALGLAVDDAWGNPGAPVSVSPLGGSTWHYLDENGETVAFTVVSGEVRDVVADLRYGEGCDAPPAHLSLRFSLVRSTEVRPTRPASVPGSR